MKNAEKIEAALVEMLREDPVLWLDELAFSTYVPEGEDAVGNIILVYIEPEDVQRMLLIMERRGRVRIDATNRVHFIH